MRVIFRSRCCSSARRLLAGCPPQTRLTSTEEGAPEGEQPTEPRRLATTSSGNPAATPVADRRRAAAAPGGADCSSGQICVGARCRYPETSVAGEILAAAAAAQATGGDHVGAMATYDEAFRASARQRAPVPPEIACASAALILQAGPPTPKRASAALSGPTSASGPASPVWPERAEVRIALARLRFEGLTLELFDREDPQERFFTAEPSRPTADAITLDAADAGPRAAGAERATPACARC